MQRKAFTKSDLDKAASNLHATSLKIGAEETQSALSSAWVFLQQTFSINPHRSWFGTGNYDIQVLEACLIKEGLELEWFDRRKSIETLDLDEEDAAIPSSSSEKVDGQETNEEGKAASSPTKRQRQLLGLIVHPKDHWLSVRWFPDDNNGKREFWNLDSRLERPTLLGDSTRTKLWLVRSNVQVLLVYRRLPVEEGNGK